MTKKRKLNKKKEKLCECGVGGAVKIKKKMYTDKYKSRYKQNSIVQKQKETEEERIYDLDVR